MTRSCSGPVSSRGTARRARPRPGGAGRTRTPWKVRTSGSAVTRAGAAGDAGLDPVAQRGGAAAAERQHQDPLRVDALGHPRGDRLDQRRGLAGAGTAEHQHRPVGVRHDLDLARIGQPRRPTVRVPVGRPPGPPLTLGRPPGPTVPPAGPPGRWSPRTASAGRRTSRYACIRPSHHAGTTPPPRHPAGNQPALPRQRSWSSRVSRAAGTVSVTVSRPRPAGLRKVWSASAPSQSSTGR